MSSAESKLVSGSFRDPSGQLFWEKGKLFRRINKSYLSSFRRLQDSGLYHSLTEKKLLVEHKVSSEDSSSIIIEPILVPFISYPYEWSFGQLKDAALATLNIRKIAIDRDMDLKDASAYNIQFLKSKPILIDTLSFERFDETKPWVAYKQYCQHFLNPLLLMARVDPSLNQLMSTNIDGIGSYLTSRILPKSSMLSPSIYSHVYLHAASQRRHADRVVERGSLSFNKFKHLGVIDNLESIIRRLSLPTAKTEWGDYYQNTNYNDRSFKQKSKIVNKWLEDLRPKKVTDLGANTGEFSKISAGLGAITVAADIDTLAVEKLYEAAKAAEDEFLFPVRVDLTSPSPGIGWDLAERESFVVRAACDVVMALALVHHLAISNNVPLAFVAKHISRYSKHAIVEFVPKEDSQVKKLLATREDIFSDYNVEGFEQAFKQLFVVKEKIAISGSARTMYFFERI